MKKQYKFVDPFDMQNEMVDVLSRGLGRALTELEMRKIVWLSDCEYETSGVLLDLFKELSQKEDIQNENLRN